MRLKNQIPKVSVVMPVCNTERFLEESIKSILDQTFKDFEFIIIFNGTTDRSLEIAKRYLEKDKRIKIILLSKPDVQKALNEGLKIAKGRYIARMDGDDLSLPSRFEKQVDYLEKNSDVFLIGSSAIVIDECGKRLGVLRKYNNSSKIKKKFLKTNTMIHPSIMFRNTREFFYREKFRSSEDYDFYLRLLTSGKKITNLPEFLIKYRVSKNSFVSTMPNQGYYLRKARKFYYQRINSGKDKYEKLVPPEGLEESDFEKRDVTLRLMVSLQDGRSKEVRKSIKIYLKKYDFQKRLIVYYILSFLPKKVVWFLQKTF